VLSYSRTWPQVPAHILPVVRVGGIPNDASYPLVRSYSRVQPLALLGENKVPMVRVEHQFPGRLLVFHSLKDLWISSTIPLRDLWGGAKIIPT
jgi:hypothetical protein